MGGSISKRHVLADCWVVKSSELGINDDTIHCRTHLGHLLIPGDTVMGFDLKNSNVNDENLDKMAADKIPDVILVKKVYGDKALRNRKRKWKLKFLNDELHRETGSVTGGDDYNDFLADLEEDPELRQNVNVYKDARKMAVDQDTASEGFHEFGKVQQTILIVVIVFQNCVHQIGRTIDLI